MRWPGTRERPAPEASRREHDAPVSLQPVVWSCAGLGELLTPTARRPCRGVVDLGPVGGAALSIYAALTPRIHVVDVLSGASGDPASGGLVPAVGALGVLERLPDRSQSLALCWECLDDLAPPAVLEVVAVLARILHPGGRLHLFGAGVGGRPLHPRRFIPGEGGRVCVVDREGSPAPARGELAPAEIERRLRPFVVEHSVLLRDGAREVVAVRP